MLKVTSSRTPALAGRVSGAKPSAAFARAVRARATLEKGSKLADFPNYYKVVRNQDGEAVTLSSFQGKKAVVLFFYPKAGTPGCTAEAVSFKEKYQSFIDKGAVVFGISGDSPAENKVFKDAQNLPYDLLTDENNILRKEFGIPNAMMVLPGRQTYVIDKDGVCALSFNEMMNATQHTDEALACTLSL